MKRQVLIFTRPTRDHVLGFFVEVFRPGHDHDSAHLEVQSTENVVESFSDVVVIGPHADALGTFFGQHFVQKRLFYTQRIA